MRALPEVQTMAALTIAGIDYRAYAATHSPVERTLAAVVGERVLEYRNKRDQALVTAVSTSTGNIVGGHVGRALNSALQSIARAFSRA